MNNQQHKSERELDKLYLELCDAACHAGLLMDGVGQIDLDKADEREEQKISHLIGAAGALKRTLEDYMNHVDEIRIALREAGKAA